MANSTFPLLIGARNGSNGGVVKALGKGRLQHAWAPRFWWYQKFDIRDVQVALDADTSQRFDLHTHNPDNLFPANVKRSMPLFFLSEVFDGGSISACAGILGDANDDNGLITTTALGQGETLTYKASTVGAAEYAPRFEAAFIPQLGLDTTGGNISALTTGIVWVAIGFEPVPGLS